MIAESTKDNLRALYRTFMLAATSLALDVLVVPVITICKERLELAKEETREDPCAATSDPAEVRDTSHQPPHFVGMRTILTRDKQKSVCQIRRYDDNSWLWTSRAYLDATRAERDARLAIRRFGWVLIGSVDPGVQDDLEAEHSEEQRTFASIVNIIVKTDKDEIAPVDAVDSIAFVVKRDQGLLGHRTNGSLRANFKEPMEMNKVPLAAISEWVREAKEGKETFGDALGEIAVILERELELDRCALWPEGNHQFSTPTKEVLWKQVEGYRMVYASLLEWFNRELALAKTLNKSGGPIERAMSYLKIINAREMGELHEELEDWADLEKKVTERGTGSPVQEAILKKSADYENAARKAWADSCRVERKTES